MYFVFLVRGISQWALRLLPSGRKPVLRATRAILAATWYCMFTLPSYAAADYAVKGHANEGKKADSFILRAGYFEGEKIPYRRDAVPLLLASADDTSRREPVASGNFRSGMVVLYPELGEPYRSIFIKIVEGIENKVGSRLVVYPVGANTDVDVLNTVLKRQGAKVVIALGRQGLQTASLLDKELAIVASGVVSVPDNDARYAATLSLTPDPTLLFARLKGLLPAVKRVYVIYDPQKSEWLIRHAREAAKLHNIELVGYEARDLGTAARTYEQVLQVADGKRDAIWLPQDSTTVDENTILPLVLRESWSRSVPVFSSSFIHVKKGVLFALYPNNLELGRSLGEVGLSLLAGDTGKKGMMPLRDVFTAVNVRTAGHIGLRLGYQQQKGFDAVFPEP
ncbi:MAG: transporter substrate-binding protein [Paucimonas sp.]|nr:transporter substrate-binding protein [Paucimonas sp.]